jgi:hypothetical protein
MILKIGTRSDENGFQLNPITEFCKNKIQPHSFDWEAIHEFNILFIDDIAPRIPLKPAVMTKGMMVDWDELDLQFQKNGLY